MLRCCKITVKGRSRDVQQVLETVRVSLKYCKSYERFIYCTGSGVSFADVRSGLMRCSIFCQERNVDLQVEFKKKRSKHHKFDTL